MDRGYLGAFARLCSVVALLCAAVSTAQAQYRFETFDYPGADATSMSSLDARGRSAGSASVGATLFRFVYDWDERRITALPSLPGQTALAFGINARGTVVGSATDDATGVVRGTIYADGSDTYFSFPGTTLFTEARAINNAGQIVGWAFTDDGAITFGFLYEPRSGRATSFAPSDFTLAQGINNRGQIVGSLQLDADQLFPGSQPGGAGFVREPDGRLHYLRVNGRSTRARGINDRGQVAGWFTDDAAGGRTRGFVARPIDVGAPFLEARDVVVFDVPGASATFPQAIDKDGRIVGSWSDAAGVQHGFRAIPVRSGER